MTTVDTVPPRGMPAESTNPLPVTRWAPTRCPSSCSVIASNTGRNQVAPKPRAAQASVSQPMPISMVRGASCAVRDFGAARQRKERDRESLHKASCGQGSGQRQHRTSERKQDSRQAPDRAKSGQETLVGQPLADKSVQRGKAGDGDRANQETERGHWHGTDQAAHFLHVARPRRMQHRPRSQEQKTLEDRMIQSVKHCGDQGYRRELADVPPRGKSKPRPGP